MKVIKQGNGTYCASSEWASVKFKSWDDSDIKEDDPKPEELFSHG